MNRADRLAAMRAAHDVLTHFKDGDSVTVTDRQGKTHELTVTGSGRCDGHYGSWESFRVRASYGPGRYTFDVTCDRIASGELTITHR